MKLKLLINLSTGQIEWFKPLKTTRYHLIHLNMFVLRKFRPLQVSTESRVFEASSVYSLEF